MLAYVFLHLAALLAVERIRNALSSANNASALERSVVAFVADANQSVRPHITVADRAFAVAALAQPANGCTAKAQKAWRLMTRSEFMFGLCLQGQKDKLFVLQ